MKPFDALTQALDGANGEIDLDDWTVFRPTRLEAIFLQFGDLQIARSNRIVDTWPVLQN